MTKGKFRVTAVFLGAIVTGAAGIMLGREAQPQSRPTTWQRAAPSRGVEAVAQLNAQGTLRIPTLQHIDSRPFIDGAVTPELVDDDVAYALFFGSLLATDGGSRSQTIQRTYIRHVLRSAKGAESVPLNGGHASRRHDTGLDHDHATHAQSGPTLLVPAGRVARQPKSMHPDALPSEDEIASLLRFVAAHDHRIRELHQDPVGTPGLETRAVVDSLIDGMTTDVGVLLAAQIHNYVRGDFKRTIKIFN